jgi:hypothetical protein
MSRRLRCTLACVFAGALALAFVGTAAAARYVVVFKAGHSGAGIRAVTKAGGRIVAVNKVGVGSVLASRTSFARSLRASGAVAGVARDASFKGSPAPRTPLRVSVNSVPAEAATCAALYGVPGRDRT